MNDNHTFVQLKGKTIDEIIKNAKKCQKRDPYGMLCAPTLLCDDKDIRKVHAYVHDFEWSDQKLMEWKAKIMQDEDVCRIMKEGKNESM